MMHNSNLMYVIYPCRLEEQDILEIFLPKHDVERP